MRITVYHEYQDDQLRPIWMVVDFRRPVPWDKSYLYIRTDAPFQNEDVTEMCELTAATSVLLEDLTISDKRPGHFGIDLQQLRARASMESPDDYETIQKLIVRMCDIEEVLQMDAQRGGKHEGSRLSTR